MNIDHYRPLLKKFQELIETKLGHALVSMVVYGSVARGTARPESDIDILIVVEDSFPNAASMVSCVRREIEEHPVSASYRNPRFGTIPLLSCLTLTRSRANQNKWLYLDMTEEAVIFFDRHNFFRARLEEVKRSMKRLGSKRVVLPDSSWYWNLKPDLRPGEVFEL